MGDHITMAATSKVVSVMNQFSIEGNLYSLTPMYEAGMIDVLKEVAAMAWVSMEVCDSPETEESVSVSSESQRIFQLTLDESAQSLFNDMESDMNRASLCSNYDHFVAGFIEGYKFLKTKNVSIGLGKG